jgi:hypothetical protein
MLRIPLIPILTNPQFHSSHFSESFLFVIRFFLLIMNSSHIHSLPGPQPFIS